MNNPNPNMNMPNPNANVPSGYTAPQTLPVIVLDDIAQAGNYPVNPGSSTIFMNFAMTEMRMRSRDMSGFPTGETVGAVSLALAIDGSADNTTIMTATPAAVEELFNVGRCVSMSIWNGCCESVAVQNVGTTPVTVNAPRISINR